MLVLMVWSYFALGLHATPADSEPLPVATAVPFNFADFGWMPGNAGPQERPLTTGPLVGEFRADAVYHYSLHRPQDDTLSGSSEAFRHGELQLTQVGIGGTFAHKGMQGRIMTQFGLYAQGTPRNDASPSRGQWQLADAYRYLAEAYAGYHVDVLHGINVQAGIFMSYVGLWSYYNFDNWTYQPSYVSSNTPWFFNGIRAQIFVTDRLKIESWLVNGWQAYGRFNHAPGVGVQVMWRPNANIATVFNPYFGTDTLGQPDRKRLHSDQSVMVRYYRQPTHGLSQAAASLTVDVGCEMGGGVSCQSQYFAGFMAYHRVWMRQDTMALTLGGGGILNPGRYLVLLPPINGATATSGTPYFSANPKDPYRAWDMQAAYDFMPSPFVTLRAEYTYRMASVPYFSGPGGVTPIGGNQGMPGSRVDGWQPDLRGHENRFALAMMVKL
jgi:hypothetical protein